MIIILKINKNFRVVRLNLYEVVCQFWISQLETRKDLPISDQLGCTNLLSFGQAVHDLHPLPANDNFSTNKTKDHVLSVFHKFFEIPAVTFFHLNWGKNIIIWINKANETFTFFFFIRSWELLWIIKNDVLNILQKFYTSKPLALSFIAGRLPHSTSSNNFCINISKNDDFRRESLKQKLFSLKLRSKKLSFIFPFNLHPLPQIRLEIRRCFYFHNEVRNYSAVGRCSKSLKYKH